MARKKKAKTRSAKKPARATRAKPAAKPKPRPKASRARVTKGAAPDSDVERRWNEYWACRTKLEDAVATVKSAREALTAAQEAERACRAEFESIKGSLTTLLDVEPASGPQKQPTPMPQRSGGGAPAGLPSPASAQGPKSAS